MSQAQPRPPPNSSQYPPFPERLPTASLDHGRWRVRFAHHPSELEAILRLRFEIFNLELGEGLDESFATGRDEDHFDRQCHHLLVEDRTTHKLVGTYRLQTYEMAEEGCGFYSAGEYDLDRMPRQIREQSIEAGRACVHQAHRNRQVLFLLWRGLALYVLHCRKRFFFGCCSLTSQRPAEGIKLYRQLDARDLVRHDFDVPPLAANRCFASDAEVAAEDEVHPPTLFGTYLRYGARICSQPALDPAFKTIDYLVLLDVEGIGERNRRLFFRNLPL